MKLWKLLLLVLIVGFGILVGSILFAYYTLRGSTLYLFM